MTKPDTNSVVRALELASQVQHMDGVLSCSNIRKECKAALPLARHQAEAEAALRWIIAHKEYLGVERILIMLAAMPNCPAIIKRMIGEWK